MKKFLQISFLLLASLSAKAQNIPIDFEPDGNGADWIWTTFENDINPALEMVDNPDPIGFNTSATVAKFTALQAGQAFAGCESLHGAGIGSFTIDASNAIIRIMVWKSVISDVGIKLVRADNWSLGEIKIANTLVNTWEQIEFDFSDHIGNTYDQIVIFPDFKNRDSDNVIYFDNIYGEEAVLSNSLDLEKTILRILPNPVSDYISIHSTQAIHSIAVYDISAKQIFHKTSNGNTSIDISYIPSGIYLCQVMLVNGSVHMEKFIKD